MRAWVRRGGVGWGKRAWGEGRGGEVAREAGVGGGLGEEGAGTEIRGMGANQTGCAGVRVRGESIPLAMCKGLLDRANKPQRYQVPR